ncbi:MAG: hemerythrin domain-containing protein [Thermaerobacter sp.]|nr:hemerythrin domain-containing protein [Thermaerobacter sp.]
MNAITMLITEHENLQAFLDRIDQACRQREEHALGVALADARGALGPELDRHILLEDANVFPRIARHLSPDMLQAFSDDHVAIQATRDRLYAPFNGPRRPLAETLLDLLRNHLAKEENMLFPAAQELMTPEELEWEPE